MKRLFCIIFGHSWMLLRFNVGQYRYLHRHEFPMPNKTKAAKTYWHWRCECCGLNKCRNRFYRYT